jgi:hypothetical protein
MRLQGDRGEALDSGFSHNDVTGLIQPAIKPQRLGLAEDISGYFGFIAGFARYLGYLPEVTPETLRIETLNNLHNEHLYFKERHFYTDLVAAKKRN